MRGVRAAAAGRPRRADPLPGTRSNRGPAHPNASEGTASTRNAEAGVSGTTVLAPTGLPPSSSARHAASPGAHPQGVAADAAALRTLNTSTVCSLGGPGGAGRDGPTAAAPLAAEPTPVAAASPSTRSAAVDAAAGRVPSTDAHAVPAAPPVPPATQSASLLNSGAAAADGAPGAAADGDVTGAGAAAPGTVGGGRGWVMGAVDSLDDTFSLDAFPATPDEPECASRAVAIDAAAAAVAAADLTAAAARNSGGGACTAAGGGGTAAYEAVAPAMGAGGTGRRGAAAFGLETDPFLSMSDLLPTPMASTHDGAVGAARGADGVGVGGAVSGGNGRGRPRGALWATLTGNQLGSGNGSGQGRPAGGGAGGRGRRGGRDMAATRGRPAPAAAGSGGGSGGGGDGGGGSASPSRERVQVLDIGLWLEDELAQELGPSPPPPSPPEVDPPPAAEPRLITTDYQAMDPAVAFLHDSSTTEIRLRRQEADGDGDGDSGGGGGDTGGGGGRVAGLLTMLRTTPPQQAAALIDAAAATAAAVRRLLAQRRRSDSTPTPGSGGSRLAAAAAAATATIPCSFQRRVYEWVSSTDAVAVVGAIDLSADDDENQDDAGGGGAAGGGGEGTSGSSCAVVRVALEDAVAAVRTGLALALHERAGAAARFCSESAADDVEGLALTQLETFDAAAGAATFRATAPASGLPCAVKLTELPCGSAAAVRALLDGTWGTGTAAAVAGAGGAHGGGGGGAGGGGVEASPSLSSGSLVLTQLLYSNSNPAASLQKASGAAATRATADVGRAAGQATAQDTSGDPELEPGPGSESSEASVGRRCVLRAAAEVALLCSLSHPNIVQVCTWHCGVCMDPGPPAGSGGGGSGADGGGGGPLLTLRLATDADFDADPPAAADASASGASAVPAAPPAAITAPSPVCVALVTDCDLGSLQTALTAGWPHGGGSGGSGGGGSGTAGPEPAADGGTDWQAVLRTLLDVACALRYLHAHRIAHTRLRPSAVQLRALPRTADPRGFTAKLADFAFAHHCGRSLPSAAAAALAATAAGAGTGGGRTAAAGTEMPLAAAPWLVATAAEGQAGSEGPEHEGLPLECLPPEGFRGAAPSPAWDVWCLGLLIWACAQGPRHPLSALPPADLPAALCGGWRPAFGPRVPPALAALAADCWAADPRQRPAAAAVVTRLRGLLRAEAAVAGGAGGGAA
ncbi:hypothetical protein HYH03_014986 [Edaphochlamys debaryana]|uniref:Protein kinase domain-containing protein n=1 Tax=Edaphochlamys debaryana TaxID=47281 RepID=A0A836BRD2_9CHLO|nr:hypothetical protein HYH03_014986 [Edaphochlamys debaryana]|eukprot:KAG2486281.1 hypothetical protein HYH03_014986 [Edaphochlamys debaryana]